jgi:hypothetical protein
MATKSSISHELLVDTLDYDASTGNFIWKVKRNSINGGVMPGDIAGRITRKYRRIGINGSRYAAHRLAWFYVNKSWPSFEIDHINGDQSDNRMCNLREATHSENLKNMKMHRDNSSGFKGVYYVGKRNKCWQAQLATDGRRLTIGYFHTREEAADALNKVRPTYHGEFARNA